MIKPTNRTDIYIESTRLIEWCREYMFGIYWLGNQDEKAISVTIQDQHQPLFWTVPALSIVPAISRLLFLQYPNPEKQGDKLL